MSNWWRARVCESEKKFCKQQLYQHHENMASRVNGYFIGIPGGKSRVPATFEEIRRIQREFGDGRSTATRDAILADSSRLKTAVPLHPREEQLSVV